MTPQFRPDVEGLRAVAVLLVIGFHYGVPGLGGGFVGVDIFFVISGYLITGILLVEVDRTGNLDLVRFYGRRARRLLPALLVVSVLTLIGSWMVLSPFELKEIAKAAFAAASYWSNFWFATRAFDYFAPESTANPFLHTWSLSVEEQFYIVWPAFILLIARARRAMVLPAITAATAVSFIFCMVLVHWQQPWAFYSPLTRAWEFGAGAMAFGLFQRRVLPASALLSASGVTAIVLSLVVIDENTTFPSWSALLPVFGTMAVLLGGQCGNAVSRSLARAPMLWVGRLSYSLYLWHWPVLVLAGIAWPDLSSAGRAACLAMTFVGAAASFHFVERPVRFGEWFARMRNRSLYVGLGITCAGMVAAALAWTVGNVASRSPFQLAAQTAATLRPAVSMDPRNCVARLLQKDLVRCDFLPGNTSGTIVLVGDSHAAQWFAPLLEFARTRQLRLVTYLKSACAVADVPIFSGRLRRETTECSEWRAALLREIAAVHPSLVIVGQHSLSYVRRDDLAPLPTQTNDVGAWASGLARSIQALAAGGARVVVIADTPFMRIHVPTCLSRAGGTHPDAAMQCGRAQGDVLHRRLADAEAQVAREHGAVYVDMNDAFCWKGHCPGVREGRILYRDTNHINEEYARTLAEPFAAALNNGASLSTAGRPAARE